MNHARTIDCLHELIVLRIRCDTSVGTYRWVGRLPADSVHLHTALRYREPAYWDRMTRSRCGAGRALAMPVMPGGDSRHAADQPGPRQGVRDDSVAGRVYVPACPPML